MTTAPPIPPAPAADSHTHHARWFFAGLRGSLHAPGMVLFATFIGFGGLAHGIGFPFWATLISTLFVWALPAQVILIGGLAAGNSLPAVALAVGLSGVRLMPLVVSMLPLLRGRRPHLVTELICAHFVAVTMWAEGFRQLPKVPVPERPAYGIGLGAGLTIHSTIATAIGYQLTGALPGPLALALLLLTPISFSILLVRNASSRTDWLAIGCGLVLAPLVAGAPGGLDLFWSGVGGGTLAFIIGRLWRRT